MVTDYDTDYDTEYGTDGTRYRSFLSPAGRVV